VLLTRPPLTASVAQGDSLDLHVLGTPPAFVLSQDQTLQFASELDSAPPSPRGSGGSKGMHTSSVSQ
jgi:hypothetical protein